MDRYSTSELNALITLARGGCAESLGQLLEMYRSYLRLVTSLQLNHQLQDKLSPSDVVQAAFVRACQRFGDFRGSSEGELIAWLRKILVSQMIMEVRRYTTLTRDVALERRLHRQMDQTSKLLDGALAANGKSPSQHAMQRERSVLLADALAQLPTHYREVIVLRHLRAYQFREVADELGQSVDSVKAIWRRAIGQLRELLGQNLF